MGIRAKIEKKFKFAQTLKTVAWVFFAVFVLLAVIFAVVNPKVIGAAFMLLIVSVVLFVVYIEKFLPFKRSIKMIEAKGMNWQELVMDIDTAPFLPQTKMHCGAKALVSKDCVIIPYSSVIWLYQHVTKSYGITVERTIVILTDDRRQFNIHMNLDELNWLLNVRRAEFPANLLVGYTAVNQNAYAQFLKRK